MASLSLRLFSNRIVLRSFSLTRFLLVLLCFLIAFKVILNLCDCRCPTRSTFEPVQDLVHTVRHVDTTRDHEPRLLLACVNSAVDKPERRALIRNTWGADSFRKHGLGVMFFVGVSRNASINQAIKAENATYGDIIQVQVTEDYYNLTQKILAVMAYAYEHLLQHGTGSEHGASVGRKYLYYLKVDDDFLVNSFSLLERIYHMVAMGDTNNIIYCRVWDEATVTRRGKYAVPAEKYQPIIYPQFCSGGAYIFSHDVVNKLLKVAPYLGDFPLEDVHITGFLRALADVPVRHGNEAYHLFTRHPEGDLMSASWNSYLFSHIRQEKIVTHVWTALQSKAEKCQHPFVDASS